MNRVQWLFVCIGIGDLKVSRDRCDKYVSQAEHSRSSLLETVNGHCGQLLKRSDCSTIALPLNNLEQLEVNIAGTRLQYLHIERHKWHKTVVLNDFSQLRVQKVKFLEEGVSSQVIQQVGEVHDFSVEVQVEGCMIAG